MGAMKKKKKPSVDGFPLPSPCWITRDTVNGVLDTHCDVWKARPSRSSNEDGSDVCWFHEALDTSHHLCMLASELARHTTVPDTDHMTIRVG